MKLGKFEVDTDVIWKFGATVATVAGMLLSNKVAANDRMKLREELKSEILKDLSK